MVSPITDTDPAPFIRLEGYHTVIPILRSRLPKDGHVLNMALISANFPDQMQIFVWDRITGSAQTGQDTWIVVISIREDYGRDIGVSMPPDAELNDEVKEVFSTSKIFHWEESHLFIGIGRQLSKMVTEIDAHIKGNIVGIAPCGIFYLDPLDAVLLDTSSKPSVTVNPLNMTSGVDFIYKNWRYATDGSLEYVRRFMTKNPTCGVFSNDTGDIVSGIVMPCNGLMGMLYTQKEFRKQQYGSLAMQSFMKIVAADGFFPSSAVDLYNDGSKIFHIKIGMKFSHYVDFVKFSKPKPETE